MNENKTVNAAIISKHRKALSILGSTLGAKFFQAETRTCWPNFEEDHINAKTNKMDIILTRDPKRYRLTGHDIIGVTTGVDGVGASKVFLNEGQKDEVSIPIGTNMEHIGVVVNDAVSKALHGDQSIIFSDAEKLCSILNTYNNDEKNRLEALREKLDKMINAIDQTINENNQKVADYRRELVASAPQNVPTTPGKGGVILVDSSEEE
jgi:ElaB/YqjD/DUF883 family membrane-anchored ribosome-binding protein